MGSPAPPNLIRYQTQPSADDLARLVIAEGLGRDFAYEADAVHLTLLGMARVAGAQLTIAVAEDHVVGWLFLSEPHPQSRWARARVQGLYEVAAFEVARPRRGRGIGSALLRAALISEWENRIVLASLDPDEWDTLGVGLSRGSYREMLLSLFRSAGFAEYPSLLDAGLGHDAASLFLVRVGAAVDRVRLREFEEVLGMSEPRSLLRINQLAQEEREDIYRRLIPEGILATFNIHPVTLTDPQGNRLVDVYAPPEQGLVWVGVRARDDDRDWCYLVKLQTTAYNNIELAFIIITDPRAERFSIDRDPEGRDTHLGSTGRNVPEEIRAMRAGLAPGQTRRGLGLLKEAIRSVEGFVGWTRHDLFVLEAMFYHNAVLYERHGFGYSVGREEMERIDREFRPGGTLFARLDGSTPFRHPGADRTVRGRSWAIQDGILGEPWRAPRMYKRVGKDEGISTFPDGPW